MVAVTVQAMKQDRERALRADFDGYVVKPITVRAFPIRFTDSYLARGWGLSDIGPARTRRGRSGAERPPA